MPPRRFGFGHGDTVHFPKGSSATWVVSDRIRKVAFLPAPLPRRISQLMRIAMSAMRRLRSRIYHAQDVDSLALRRRRRESYLSGSREKVDAGGQPRRSARHAFAYPRQRSPRRDARQPGADRRAAS